jgi:hypothetical protein
MALAAALATVILATTAFAQETTTPAPTPQPTATPTATQTPEPTATPTSESTSTPTPTPTPEPTTAPTTPESTTERTIPESTTEEPGGFPSITVTPTQGPPGTTVTVTGSGWEDWASRGWSVPIETGLVGDVPGIVDPLPARTMARPNADGTFSVPLTIPESAPPGREVEIGAILGHGSSVDASFTITQSDQGSQGSKQPSGGPSQQQQNPTQELYLGDQQPIEPQNPVDQPNGGGKSSGQNSGGGNPPKQDQQDNQKNGLITRIIGLLSPIFQPRQGEPQKEEQGSRGFLHTIYCTLFSNAQSCQGESHGQGSATRSPNPIREPGDLSLYGSKCFNTSTFPVPTIIKEGFIYLCPSTNHPQNVTDPVNDLVVTDAVIKEGLQDIAGMGQCYNPNSSLYWWFKGHPLIPYSSCTEPLSVHPSKIVLSSDTLQRKIESLQQKKPGDVVGPDEVVWADCTPGYTDAPCYPEGKLAPGEVERFHSLAKSCALGAAPHIGKSAEVVDSIAKFVQKPTHVHLQEVIISLVPLPTNVVACVQLEEEYVGILRGSVVPWPSH